MYSILLHVTFLNRANKTFRRYRELKQQLTKALAGLQGGPGSGHTPMRHIADSESQAITYRMRVGRHRMIYRIYPQEQLIVPLFLSERPRNEATYRDWEGIASAIAADYEAREFDPFRRWEGTL